ncbi:membrane protein [Oceanisphaera litoralis]|uniref:virulence factor BrkB family protein n=1 Tax=Oceanisphaera litoralis TaxID=225144 RepID=UPI001958B8D9|nr:virulence factor BrkB family protein [Oceanisphaera litoralis]MBM7456197.1 membrane protein [Oceanisphaera litoralis]
MNQVVAQVRHRLRFVREHGASFVLFLLKRIQKDRLKVTAGYLAYITLLSLVPMLAVVFAMMSAFPMFAELRDTIQTFVFSNFVPAAGEVVQDSIQGFIDNASKTTAIGVAALAVTAMLLISAIDENFNHIWRVTQKRRWSVAFSTYWMILTLGPILAGASLALTSYLTSLHLFQVDTIVGVGTLLLGLLPFLLSTLMFVVFYMVVPNVRVRFSHAICGALVAALLFELAKRAFAFYITRFPSYEAIYGALATIPILFVWIYLSWMIALLGAELTAGLGDYERRQGLSFEDENSDSPEDLD